MASDTDTRTAAIRELSEVIAPIAAKYHITAAYLFGSRARDDYRDDSDYDIIIEVSPEYDWDDHMDFINDVAEALGRKVDVITRRSLDGDAFSVRALGEMIRIC